MKIYLVCETIDLGYHVVKAFTCEEDALIECSRLNDDTLVQLSNRMYNSGQYTQEQIKSCLESPHNKYRFEMHETELLGANNEHLQ